MTVHIERAPVNVRFFTPGMFVVIAVMVIGAAAGVYRLILGLAASTNLTDSYPWGIWVALDVESRVALAAGGFTTAALAHIFHREKFEPLLRGAILTALLGYTFAVTGLAMDLGRYYNIWHPMLPNMWQGNSVLFEVAMCVMAYMTVLYVEFAPAACERFLGRVNLPGPLAFVNRIADTLLTLLDWFLHRALFLFIIGGVVLSCMHQSALGSLILVAPHKTSPLWFTPVIPGLFLLSAISVGFPVVIFESLFASWAFNRKPPMELLSQLAKFASLFLSVYCLAKVSDFLIREAYRHLFDNPFQTAMFGIEIALSIVIPLAMFLNKRVRTSPVLLFVACTTMMSGIILNRMNVFLVGFRPRYAATIYVPSVAEILMSAGLIAATIFMYRLLVTIFPVLPRVKASADQERPSEEARYAA